MSYRGYTMTWQRGRQLATLNGNGLSATYQYDSDGLRNTKTVNGVTHEYYYDGTSLIAEKRGNDMIVWNGSGFSEEHLQTGVMLVQNLYGLKPLNQL